MMTYLSPARVLVMGILVRPCDNPISLPEGERHSQYSEYFNATETVASWIIAHAYVSVMECYLFFVLKDFLLTKRHGRSCSQRQKVR